MLMYCMLKSPKENLQKDEKTCNGRTLKRKACTEGLEKGLHVHGWRNRKGKGVTRLDDTVPRLGNLLWNVNVLGGGDIYVQYCAVTNLT